MLFIIPSFFPFPFSPFYISCVILTSKSENCTANEPAKLNKILWIKDFWRKMIDYHFKGLYKTICYKTKSNFLLFSLTAVWVFLLFIKVFVNFEKVIRFYHQAFIVYKSWKNSKISIEIFRQRLIVSNVILPFLDHLNYNIFFVTQPWWPTKALPFQNLWIPPWKR